MLWINQLMENGKRNQNVTDISIWEDRKRWRERERSQEEGGEGRKKRRKERRRQEKRKKQRKEKNKKIKVPGSQLPWKTHLKLIN